MDKRTHGYMVAITYSVLAGIHMLTVLVGPWSGLACGRS